MTGCGGSPCRDAEKFCWSDHFKEETFGHELRFLTEQMVKETLEDGDDCNRVEAGPGKLRRRKTFDGIDVVLVLPEREAEIITGWTEITDLKTALASSQWAQDAIEKIQAFQNFEHKRPYHRDPDKITE